jgi:spermidine/putrescine transport system substrate-binding protein
MDGDKTTTLGRRQFLQRTGGAVLASSLGGGLLAACGGDSSTTVSSGGEIGGTLNLLNWAGYDDPRASAAFRKQHDVEIKSTGLNNPDEIITKLKAGGTSQYDLVSPLASQAPGLVAAGVLQPMDYDKIPRTKAYLPYMAPLGPEAFAVDGKAYVAPYIWGINALVYNRAAVPREPRSWRDLLADEYKGRIALMDTASDNFAIWPRVLGYDPETMTRQQFDDTTDLLIEIKTQHARTLAASYDDIADQLARGELWACASLLWIALPSLARRKGPGAKSITWTLPAEGGGTWIDGWVIPKDAPNPSTAHAFVNAMLGARPQAMLAEGLVSGTVVRDAVPLLSAEARRIYPYDDMAALEDTAPIFEFPGPDAPVQYTEWVKAWTRVQAA